MKYERQLSDTGIAWPIQSQTPSNMVAVMQHSTVMYCAANYKKLYVQRFSAVLSNKNDFKVGARVRSEVVKEGLVTGKPLVTVQDVPLVEPCGVYPVNFVSFDNLLRGQGLGPLRSPDWPVLAGREGFAHSGFQASKAEARSVERDCNVVEGEPLAHINVVRI